MYEVCDLIIRLDNAKLRRLRKERGLTQEMLAGITGICVRHIIYLECGKSNNVFLENAMKLSIALDVDVNDLIKTTYKKAQ